ncbi:hypothetical protein FRC04_011259 [Tulasnella sp. 424]|nr:hypothetical protein FRC04_011259 [Tulasnella sp. 424]
MSAPFEDSHPPAQHAPQPQFHYEPPLGSTENRKPNSPEPVHFPPDPYHHGPKQIKDTLRRKW